MQFLSRKFFVFLALVMIMWGPVPVRAANIDELPDFLERKAANVYDLADRFPTAADLQLIQSDDLLRRGIWQEDRFVFPGAGQSSDVQLVPLTLSGTRVEVIRCRPSPDQLSRIHFSQVAPGADFVLYLRVSSTREEDGTPRKETGAVYLKVFAGRKLLLRTRMTSEDGWVEKKLSLGSSRFLKAKLNLSLEITSDDLDDAVMLAGFVV